MLLPYWLRLVCLVLLSVGLIQSALVLLLQLLTPAINRALGQLSARWQERACFAMPVIPHIAAFTLATVVVAPQYILSETNLLKERVGVICVAGALVAAARYAYALVRASRLMRKAQPRHKATVAACAGGASVQVAESEYPLLAVSGLLLPKIIISRSLLDTAMLSPRALQIAIAHEAAHIRHYDNLKLFVLSSLALPLGANAAVRRWRQAAEIAADQDAVAGSRARAILLAETLLVAARAVPAHPPASVTLGLLPYEEDLEKRIHHLLHNESGSGECTGRFTLLGGGLLLLAAVWSLLQLTLASFHGLAEYVLHLG
jgi:beta-lactamase regulating signal transducer with metallopeptidase domain